MVIRCILAVCLMAVPALAQTATLRGQVTDESGGLVPGAKVSVSGPGGVSKTTAAGSDGSYTFTDLAPGDYIVHASAPSLALREPLRLSLKAGQQVANLVLNVVVEKQEVTVEDGGKPAVSTEASANASAVVLRGTDLDALSDNPDDLAADRVAPVRPGEPDGGIGKRNLPGEREQSAGRVADAVDVLTGHSPARSPRGCPGVNGY